MRFVGNVGFFFSKFRRSLPRQDERIYLSSDVVKRTRWGLWVPQSKVSFISLGSDNARFCSVNPTDAGAIMTLRVTFAFG
jgi:hypothetical protein